MQRSVSDILRHPHRAVESVTKPRRTWHGHPKRHSDGNGRDSPEIVVVPPERIFQSRRAPRLGKIQVRERLLRNADLLTNPCAHVGWITALGNIRDGTTVVGSGEVSWHDRFVAQMFLLPQSLAQLRKSRPRRGLTRTFVCVRLSGDGCSTGNPPCMTGPARQRMPSRRFYHQETSSQDLSKTAHTEDEVLSEETCCQLHHARPQHSTAAT